MERFIIKSSIDNQVLSCVDFCSEIENPNLILQICHGMQEHIFRYENFAKFLGENGVKVVGMDNRGHGATGDVMGIMGHISDEKGYEKLPEDVRDLNKYLRGKYPNAKLVIFGHSMGSIIVRNFLNKYSNYVDGAILCGTTGLFNKSHRFGLMLGKLITKISGNRRKLKFINKMPFKKYNEKINNPSTVFDWLSTDKAVVEKYVNDKYCGFNCTNSFYVDLLTMTKNMSNPKNIDNIVKTLPIFFISGSMDPVGDYEKGVIESYELFKDLGLGYTQVELYSGMRHEILNEVGKEEVYNDILKFIKKI